MNSKIQRRGFIFGFSAFIIAIGLSGVRAAANEAPISPHDLPNFHVVEDSIYRGGRPTDAGLYDLKQLGVRTIVNLENDDEAIAHENVVALEDGIIMYSVPMSGFWWPNDQRVYEALQLLNDKAKLPVYVHCQHGQDRTGLIVGLFRVEHDRWQPKIAYSEMLKLGFHRILFMLDLYFHRRTGL